MTSTVKVYREPRLPYPLLVLHVHDLSTNRDTCQTFDTCSYRPVQADTLLHGGNIILPRDNFERLLERNRVAEFPCNESRTEYRFKFSVTPLCMISSHLPKPRDTRGRYQEAPLTSPSSSSYAM